MSGFSRSFCVIAHAKGLNLRVKAAGFQARDVSRFSAFSAPFASMTYRANSTGHHSLDLAQIMIAGQLLEAHHLQYQRESMEIYVALTHVDGLSNYPTVVGCKLSPVEEAGYNHAGNRIISGPYRHSCTWKTAVDQRKVVPIFDEAGLDQWLSRKERVDGASEERYPHERRAAASLAVLLWRSRVRLAAVLHSGRPVRLEAVLHPRRTGLFRSKSPCARRQ